MSGTWLFRVSKTPKGGGGRKTDNTNNLKMKKGNISAGLASITSALGREYLQFLGEEKLTVNFQLISTATMGKDGKYCQSANRKELTT